MGRTGLSLDIKYIKYLKGPDHFKDIHSFYDGPFYFPDEITVIDLGSSFRLSLSYVYHINYKVFNYWSIHI